MDLSKILKSDSDPNSPRQFIRKGRQVILQVKNAIQCQQVHYIDYDQPRQAFFCPQDSILQQYCGKMVLYYGCILQSHPIEY